MAQTILLLCCLLACLLATTVHCETVLRLDSLAWTLTNANGSIVLNTTVPAYPVEVLRANGVIGDPLYRYGEQDSRWAAYEVWNFSVTFSAGDAAQLASQEQVVLFLGGVDTFGTVTLNGQKVLETDNFHRHWTVPVKPFLDVTGPNTLTISIAPAYNKTIELQQQHPYYIPTLYNTGSIGAYNFARKPAFDFGWGPAFAAAGIHGTVKLLAFSKPTLAGAYLGQTADNTSFHLKITTQFLVPESGGYGALHISLPELNLTSEQDVQFSASADNAADLFEAATTLEVSREDVQLWWPAGGNYGPHKLYDVTIKFEPLGAWCAPSAEAHTRPERGQLFEDPFFSVGGGSDSGGIGIGLDLSDGFKAAINIGDLFDFNINIGQSTQSGAGSNTNTGGSAVAGSSQCSVVQKRIGFRTVELVRDPLEKAVKDLFGDNRGFNFTENPKFVNWSILFQQEGWQWALDANGQWRSFPGNRSDVPGAIQESYYFKVNGVPVFFKGANVIPLSVFPSNVTAELVEATLEAAVEANQNLLRVWGGGLYHTEPFYNFCDEHGIMIWQDAMFGGSHYPRNSEFLANIEEEITQQAERLSWHPSIAVWCGNNEMELSYEWANNTLVRSNRNMFLNDYMANILTLRKAIKKVNPSSIFVSSSPTKGPIIDTEDEFVPRWGWIGDTRYGSVHHYDYMSDCENFRSYPTAKFVTEFGWQSYSMPETYAAAMQPEVDWGVGNSMNEFRNRRTDVTPQFLYQYGLHFKLPSDWNPADPQQRMQRFKSYLWIGHMQHARCYETALNFWRRLRSHPTSLTMGVMYWQLNDIWAGASWSSLDVAGRWKPVHYAVKRAYAPLAIQAVRDNSTIDIFIVSDLVNTTDVHVTLQLVSLNDSASTCSADVIKAQNILSFTAPVPGLFASKVWSLGLDALLELRPRCTATTCFLTSTAEAAGVSPTESQLWFVPFKDVTLPDPEVRIESVQQATNNTLNIKVVAERPAALVLVSEVAPLLGHFNDNAFSLNPCEPRIVMFTAQKGAVNSADLTNGSFHVESLYDHSRWESPAPNATAAASPAPAAAQPQHQTVAQMVAAVEKEEEHPDEHAKGNDAAHPMFVPPGQTHEQVKAQQQQLAKEVPVQQQHATAPAVKPDTQPVVAAPLASEEQQQQDKPLQAEQQPAAEPMKPQEQPAAAASAAKDVAKQQPAAPVKSDQELVTTVAAAPEDLAVSQIVAAGEQQETVKQVLPQAS